MHQPSLRPIVTINQKFFPTLATTMHSFTVCSASTSVFPSQRPLTVHSHSSSTTLSSQSQSPSVFPPKLTDNHFLIPNPPTAFWGQCRLGELLPSSSAIALSNPFSLSWNFKRSVQNPQACLLHLPRTKTHHQGQDIVLVNQREPINLIFLLENHIWVNNLMRDRLLFSFTSSEGFSLLTKPLFLQRCNDIWIPLSYPHTTGHCFRIRGTTELLIAGISPEVVKATGHWSSESFHCYWHSLDDIAPQHIRHLPPASRKRKRW